MNWAGLAAVCLNERIKSIKSEFVCLITEPHNYGGKVASLPRNCHLVPDTLKEKECRAAIIASPNLELVEVSELCTKDCAVAYCTINKTRILICSIYLDINKAVVQEWLDKIIKYATDKEVELIIGADTNCHSNLFGEDTNKRGRDFEEFVIENALAIKNVGTVPTFETIRAGKKW